MTIFERPRGFLDNDVHWIEPEIEAGNLQDSVWNIRAACALDWSYPP